MESNESPVETLKAEIAKEEAVAETVAQVEAKADAAPVEPTPEQKLKTLLEKRKTGEFTLKDSIELRRLKKQMAAMSVQAKYFRKLMGQWRRSDDKSRNRLLNQVKAAARTLGKENFAMLKDLYTQNIPEVRNAEGVVTQEASSQINYQGLLAEARNAIVIERDSRIKSGKRKKTTGRSSKRRLQKNTFNFLTKRNAEETVKQAQAVK